MDIKYLENQTSTSGPADDHEVDRLPEVITTPNSSALIVHNDGISIDRVTAFAQRISVHWQKACHSILEVAIACAEFDEACTPKEKKHLLEILKLSAPAFSKLVKIGSKRRLRDEAIQERLPASVSTMYEISNLTDQQFDLALAKGTIHPGVTREQVKKFARAGSLGRSRTSTEGSVQGELFCIYSNTPIAPDQQSQLREEMTELADKYGLRFENFAGERLLADVCRLVRSGVTSEAF
jgi:hypothetical protein